MERPYVVSADIRFFKKGRTLLIKTAGNDGVCDLENSKAIGCDWPRR